jgi:hypothetical protein
MRRRQDALDTFSRNGHAGVPSMTSANCQRRWHTADTRGAAPPGYRVAGLETRVGPPCAAFCVDILRFMM